MLMVGLLSLYYHMSQSLLMNVSIHLIGSISLKNSNTMNILKGLRKIIITSLILFIEYLLCARNSSKYLTCYSCS